MITGVSDYTNSQKFSEHFIHNFRCCALASGWKQSLVVEDAKTAVVGTVGKVP